MVGGTWLAVPRPWSCGSTVGIRLERAFIQIAASGSSEPISPDAAIFSNGSKEAVAVIGCFYSRPIGPWPEDRIWQIAVSDKAGHSPGNL